LATDSGALLLFFFVLFADLKINLNDVGRSATCVAPNILPGHRECAQRTVLNYG